MLLRAGLFAICGLGGLFLSGLSVAQTPSLADTDHEAETGRWHLSIAAGAGYRSNPLWQGRNLPQWLMLEAHYYGDQWFFDNGTLGYTLTSQPAWQLSLVSRLNDEKLFFHRASPVAIFPQGLIADSGIAGPQKLMKGPLQLGVDDVQSRPWALDGGLQLDWFAAESLQLSLNWWHDLSQQYDGQHAKISAMYHVESPVGHWNFGAALHWKNRQLMDTYYGLTEDEAGERWYGQADWQPELLVQWSKALTERWAVLSSVRVRWLHLDVENAEGHTMANPLQQQAQVHSLFFGLSYRFL